MSFALDSFNFGIVYKYRDVFLNGVLTTLEIASVCLVLSVFFGIFVALMRMSKSAFLWRPAAAYIQRRAVRVSRVQSKKAIFGQLALREHYRRVASLKWAT